MMGNNNSDTTRKVLFDTVIGEHGALVAKLCYMYGHDDHSRKDLYQECLINLWEGLPSFKGDAKLTSWIYRTCINTCISCYRHNRRHMGLVSLDSITHPAVPPQEDDRPSQLHELYTLINMLNPLDKAIIMLWLDEKSYDEIAAITGLVRNTVASRLRRIKARLQQLSSQ